jgi:hypothetical protein
MSLLLDILIELELHCLKPEVRSSSQELDKILADDFMEITSTGIAYDKAHALSRIPNDIVPTFTQQNFEIRMLTDGVAQLIYKATIQKVNEESVTYSLRNSIWKLNGNSWQMLFHQGTICEPFEVSNK